MTFFPCRSAGKDRIKSCGSGSSPNQRAYRRPSACMPVQHPGRGFRNQERPLGLASLLLPPRRPAGLLPRPIGCCTPLALCAPICLLYTAHAYFIQFHPDTYTGHDGHKISLLGIQNDGGGNPEYVTIPCFATPRVNLNAPAGMDTQTRRNRIDPGRAR